MSAKRIIQIGRILRTVAQETLPLIKPYNWMNGACYMFAQAVHQVFEGEIVGICTQDKASNDFPVEHFAVLKQGFLMDASGAAIISLYLRSYHHRKIKRVYAKRLTSKNVWQGDHWYDQAIVAKVVSKLSESTKGL